MVPSIAGLDGKAEAEGAKLGLPGAAGAALAFKTFEAAGLAGLDEKATDEGDLDDTLSKSAGVDGALESEGGGSKMFPRDVDVCNPPASDGLP